MTASTGSLVLSDATGGYREFRPAAALDLHFQCVWSNAITGDPGTTDLAVVPDGCIDLIWGDGELIVAGPDVVAALASMRAAHAIIGVRFRPGAAQKWLGLPMAEIVGARLPLAGFWGARAREIAARVSDADAAQRMRVFEQALCRIATGVEAPDSGMGFVFNALKTESAGRGMSIILDRLDVSPRTLRRRCHEAFGYGPKTLDRILRFQRFLALARNTTRPALACLAFDAGYADQAHLTREVRRLSELSPASLLAQVRA